MTERRGNLSATDEASLDPTEKWGRGRNESHPEPTAGARDASGVLPMDADVEREVAEERGLVGEDVPGEPRPPRGSAPK